MIRPTSPRTRAELSAPTRRARRSLRGRRARSRSPGSASVWISPTTAPTSPAGRASRAAHRAGDARGGAGAGAAAAGAATADRGRPDRRGRARDAARWRTSTCRPTRGARSGPRCAAGLNGVLPPTSGCRRSTLAPAGFDARFSALCAALRLPRHRRGRGTRCAGTTRWPGPGRWTSTRMNEAARRLLGEHDFAAYCKRREARRRSGGCSRCDWQRERRPGVLEATVEADAFCHSMVRALVGALLAVGEGRRDRPGRPGAGRRRAGPVGRGRAGARADAWSRSATRRTPSWPPGHGPAARTRVA